MTMQDNRTESAFILLLFLFSFILYVNSANAPFYFDDYHMIEANTFIKDFRYILHLFKGYVTSDNVIKGMCRPFLMLTFALNYHTGGLNPQGYHIINILLHLLNALFLWYFLKFFRKESPLAVLAMVTMLFLSHPVNTETVNYLSSRSDLMVTLFVGCGFLSYLYRRHFLSLVCYASSLLVKETGLCLPLFVLAYDSIFTFTSLRPSFIRKKLDENKRASYYTAVFLVTCMYFLYKHVVFTPTPVELFRSYYSNFLTQSAVTFFYLRLFLWPYPLNLIHYFPDINNIFSPGVFLAVLGVISMIVMVFALRKRSPVVSFGIAFFLIGLLPKFYAPLSLVAAEHHFYMPSVGVYLILFILAGKVYSRYRKVFIYTGVGLISLFTVLVWFRNYEFTDSFLFWRLSVDREPLAATAHNQLGVEYLKKGNLEAAEEQFREALLYSERGHTTVHSKANLAAVYRNKKEYAKATAILEELAALDPVPARIYENLGVIYMELGKESEALSAWGKELELYPRSPRVYALLGLHYLGKKDLCQAGEAFNKALQLDPDTPLAYFGLGQIARRNADPASAILYYRKAISLKPDLVGAHYALGLVYAEKGDHRAVQELKRVIQLQPDFKEAYNDLAVFYASITPPEWRLSKIYAEKAVRFGYPVDKGFLNLIDKNLKTKQESRI